MDLRPSSAVVAAIPKTAAVEAGRPDGGTVKGFDRSPRLVRFEGFQLDLRAGELRADAGKTLRLSEQPFRILTMLLEPSGEVLTREEIRKELWPDKATVQ